MQYCGKKPVYKTAPLCDVIGTHAARRTFVVHALEQGMSPEMVIYRESTPTALQNNSAEIAAWSFPGCFCFL